MLRSVVWLSFYYKIFIDRLNHNLLTLWHIKYIIFRFNRQNKSNEDIILFESVSEWVTLGPYKNYKILKVKSLRRRGKTTFWKRRMSYSQERKNLKHSSISFISDICVYSQGSKLTVLFNQFTVLFVLKIVVCGH